jgi:uncharacterized protein
LNTISDSSPLIGLNAIGRLDLLRRMFHEVIVPPGVAQEILSFSLPEWILVVPLPRSEANPLKQNNLGLGETEAINLSIQLRSERIILDDAAARSAATAQGLRVIGVLGILMSAKQQGLIRSIREDLDALKSASFHISPRIHREILARAGEL